MELKNNLTKRENEIIEKELRAFNNNFMKVKVIKNNRYYFIYQNNDITQWIYNTNNINTVKGWLYGCVQTKNKMVRGVEN